MKKLSYEKRIANLRKLVTHLPVEENFVTEINGTKYEIVPTTEKKILACKGEKKYLLLEYTLHGDNWEKEEVGQIYAVADSEEDFLNEHIQVWNGIDDHTGQRFYQWHSIHEPNEIEKLVTKIAQEKLDIPTLETQYSDRDDFHERSVWRLKDALVTAYEAGKREGEKIK